MIIAIDGPAASGKSTTARLVARKLGFTYLDTGAMYRAVTLALIQKKISFGDIERIKMIISRLDLQLQTLAGETEISLDGRNVSREIRTKKVTENVSAVSAVPEVRTAMVELQKTIARNRNCVVEGRDIGTVVFPDAEWKFYMVADDRTRAERRRKELESMGENPALEELIREIQLRDHKDSTRDHSPLKKAKDAIEIDTSSLTIDEQVLFIIQTVNNQRNPINE